MADNIHEVQHSRFSDSLTQVLIMSMVVFCGPGMFNALNSIGLGGDPTIGTQVNCALFAFFMASSFIAPTIVNIVGAKWGLLLGGVGYPLYSLAMYYHTRSWGIAAGAFLGLCAGLLWTAQGQLMMSYPDRSRVGRYVAIFWAVFNSGGFMGCMLSFGLNYYNRSEGPEATSGSSLSASTYWTFFAVMIVGCFLALFLLPLNKVTRQTADGDFEYVVSADTDAETESVKGMALITQELTRTFTTFRHPTMCLLVPLFLYSNFFYAYHFGMIGERLNGRTGSLTAGIYWVSQIIGSVVLQGFLDWDGMSQKRRMYVSFTGILLYVVSSWGIGGYVQCTYDASESYVSLDLASDIKSPLPVMICLFVWGFVDSFVQIWCYWMMGQLSKEPEDLACFTAFYKFWQNFGAFMSFLLGIWPGSQSVSYWVNVVLIAVLVAPTFLAIRNASKPAKMVGLEVEKIATQV